MEKRVVLEVRLAGVFESGLNLSDKDGKFYRWYTRAYNSEIFFMGTGVWFKISATLKENNTLFNVRKLKD